MPCPEIDKLLSTDMKSKMIILTCLTIYKRENGSITIALDDRKNSNEKAVLVTTDKDIACLFMDTCIEDIKCDIYKPVKETPICVSVAANVESLTKETPIA